MARHDKNKKPDSGKKGGKAGKAGAAAGSRVRFDALSEREIKRFSTEFLSKPTRQVAREWGISDYTVRNWAKRLGLGSDIRQAIDEKTEIRFAQHIATSSGLSASSEAEIVSAVADMRVTARMNHRNHALQIQRVSGLHLDELESMAAGRDLLVNLASGMPEEQATALQAAFSFVERAKALANVAASMERGINAERKALSMDRADADEAKAGNQAAGTGFTVFVPEKDADA